MKLTKFFALAISALAFVGCGNGETPEPQPQPEPQPTPSGNVTLKVDSNAVVIGEVVRFTVVDATGQDVTSVAKIYDPELNELVDKTFTTTEPGIYSFFATVYNDTTNTVLVRFMATMPDVPEDTDPQNTVFNHRPLVIDHTGVNCGYCPGAMDALKALENSEWAGKYNEVTCHAGVYATGDPAASQAATTLAQFQSGQFSGYPAIIVNFYNKAESYPVSYIKTALKGVHKGNNGADVGIAMAVEGDSEAIYCASQIKSAKTQEYYVNAWLLESGINSPNQAGATKPEHKIYNHALRNFSEAANQTSVAGINVGTIAEGETFDYACAINMISTKWVSANMGVLVVVSAKGSNGRIDVVNSAYCKVGQTMNYEYL